MELNVLATERGNRGALCCVRFNMRRKLVVAAVFGVLLSACGDGSSNVIEQTDGDDVAQQTTSFGDRQSITEDPVTETEVSAGVDQSGGTTTTVPSDDGSTSHGESVAQEEPNTEYHNTYDSFASHELAQYVPAPHLFGDGWDAFAAESFTELTALDPATDPVFGDCGIAETVVMHDGVAAEYGFGDSTGDFAVIISRGDQKQLEAVYTALVTVMTCEALHELEGLVFENRAGPLVAGADESFRYTRLESNGSSFEGLILLLPEMVYLTESVVWENGPAVDVEFFADAVLEG